MKIIFLLWITLFFLPSCEEMPITPFSITKSLFLAQEKKVMNHSYGYAVTSVGKKGKLFSEFNTPQFFNTNLVDPHDSIIRIFDINLLQEKYFNLKKFVQNPHAEKIKGRYFPSELYFTDNLNTLNDSIIVGKSTDMNYGTFFLYNKNTRDKKWIKFNHRFRYPNNKYEDQSYLNSICVHPQKKKIMVAYRFFDLIQLHDDEGKLLKEVCFSKIQKPLLSTIASGMAPKAIFYHLSIYGTDNYCYILRGNKTGIQLLPQPHELSGQLIVMDWEGNIKNICH